MGLIGDAQGIKDPGSKGPKVLIFELHDWQFGGKEKTELERALGVAEFEFYYYKLKCNHWSLYFHAVATYGKKGQSWEDLYRYDDKYSYDEIAQQATEVEQLLPFVDAALYVSDVQKGLDWDALTVRFPHIPFLEIKTSTPFADPGSLFDAIVEPGWSYAINPFEITTRLTKAVAEKMYAYKRVFISYARENEASALRIYSWLSKRYRVWIDLTEMRAGERWEDRIYDSLEDSDMVLVLLSNAALARNGFYQVELKRIKELMAYVPENRSFIIPIRLDDCEVPRFMRGFHYLDYFSMLEETFKEALVRAIEIQA